MRRPENPGLLIWVKLTEAGHSFRFECVQSGYTLEKSLHPGLVCPGQKMSSRGVIRLQMCSTNGRVDIRKRAIIHETQQMMRELSSYTAAPSLAKRAELGDLQQNPLSHCS